MKADAISPAGVSALYKAIKSKSPNASQDSGRDQLTSLREKLDYGRVSSLSKTLMTAEEVSEYVLVSPDRLIQLAQDGAAPHVVVDGNGPYFVKSHLVNWVLENLVFVQGGESPTAILRVVEVLSKKPMSVPPCLEPMRAKLRSVPIGYYPPSVYFLVRDNRVVYVGQSLNAVSRIANGHKDKKWDYALSLQVPADSLTEIEDAFIQALKPEYNGTVKDKESELTPLIERVMEDHRLGNEADIEKPEATAGTIVQEQSC